MDDGPLDDGSYAVIIFDAEDLPDGSALVEVTILAGDKKGEVLALRANDLGADSIELLGMPGTLTVSDGVPGLVIEP